MGKRAQILTDPDKLAAAVDAYFAASEATAIRTTLKNNSIKIRREWPSVVGLALHLGVSKSTVLRHMGKEGDGADNAGTGKVLPYNTDTDTSATRGGEHDQDGTAATDSAANVMDAQFQVRAILARARQRIEQIILDGAANGDIESRIAAALLCDFGYGVKSADSGEIVIRFADATAEQVRRYSR